MTGENVVVPSMNLERMLSMKGGKGEASYLNNSQAQAQHAGSMLHLLREALDRVALGPTDAPFVVADLGCSCGTNTIHVVEVIIKHMVERYEAAGCGGPPEFSAFFSDLPSNDFNTLFQLLPPRSYFAAGVPGSFYRRLFPAKSVDVFYSAFSLHWLSRVPDVVVDKRSTAYNKGRVFIDGANESIVNAYKKQFKWDLTGFLRARSKEMKRGGSMFLVCLGRTCSDPSDQGGAGLLFATHFQDAWEDLVQQDLISSDKRDTFNIPVYAASLDEFKEVVEAEGSFIINRLETFKGGSPLVVARPDDPVEVGRSFANTCRSVAGVLVEAHIGDRLGDVLFDRVAVRAASRAEELKDKLQFYHIVASLSLPNNY
ncbi:Indole-3-acetate O-methyltransferase 1 [Striga hermonthica]|uniref:Indole-3-acetate O-methyltransferase 1 n=1 Tax=Striga hermonthica TaxID=68872 RepID=A0A9N7RIS0_STRHE|nr:Indole-3-acetate O-methyltransferase 1 [Striga hermonthica]